MVVHDEEPKGSSEDGRQKGGHFTDIQPLKASQINQHKLIYRLEERRYGQRLNLFSKSMIDANPALPAPPLLLNVAFIEAAKGFISNRKESKGHSQVFPRAHLAH